MSVDDGAEEEGVAPEATELPPPGDVKEADDDFTPFDEESEDFALRAGKHVTGPDGLPVQVDETSMSDIPVLSTETLVCMADTRKFVLRAGPWDETTVEFLPTEVERVSDGRWRVPAKLAFDRLKEKELAPQISARFIFGEHVQVQPIRPQCRHYVRMQLPQYNAALPVGKKPGVTRLCSARRSTEGAMMRINEMPIFACSIRKPRDLASEKNMDDFDAMKIHQGAHRVYVPIKGDDPNKSASTGEGAGGIFGGTP